MAPKWAKWGRIGPRHVPFWGILVSGKKVLAFLGGASVRGMSLFGGFLFPEKRFWRFWGCIGGPRKNVHVPFWGFLIWKKNTVGFNDVFSIIGV
jgi:hypothetical protein